MRLRTLQAPTMAEAMRLVRDELGADAIIVSTTESTRDGVRITAAVETPEPDLDFSGAGTEDALIDRISETLDSHRVPRMLADRITSVAAELGTTDLLQTLAGALDLIFGFTPITANTVKRPILVFGPPGAGKTSAIAKLAARAVLGGTSVTMVTTDTIRAGALQQLEAYGKRLDVPVLTAESPEALATSIEGIADRFVLIDTTSVNPFLLQDVSQLRSFADTVRCDGLLVMNAGREPLEAQEMAAEFRQFVPSRLLITGLDMSRRLGGILSALHGSGAAFAEISATPEIVDGLRPVNPVMLARLLLEISNSTAPGDDEAFRGVRANRHATGWK